MHIFNVRKEPKVRFLADPWDLFEDGQLILENSRKYKAKLNLRLRQPTKGADGNGADTGFDFVQIREHEEDEMDEDEGPKEEKENGKGKAVERKLRKVEFGEAQPLGDNAVPHA